MADLFGLALVGKSVSVTFNGRNGPFEANGKIIRWKKKGLARSCQWGHAAKKTHIYLVEFAPRGNQEKYQCWFRRGALTLKEE